MTVRVMATWLGYRIYFWEMAAANQITAITTHSSDTRQVIQMEQEQITHSSATRQADQTRPGKTIFCIGYKSGYSNIGDGSAFTGNSNVYIGDQSGLGNSTGYSNVYIGQQAGIGLSTGINVVYPPVNNVYIGYQSGYSEYTGTFNTFIGYQTGFTNNSGNWNTFIGFQSGYKNTAGNANMFIGYRQGSAIRQGFITYLTDIMLDAGIQRDTRTPI